MSGDDSDVVLARIDRLQRWMDDEPEGTSWRVRARVGEKARWYELPESDGDEFTAKPF